MSDATTSGAEEHIEALALRYLGRRYPRYRGADDVRVVLQITPTEINTMG